MDRLGIVAQCVLRRPVVHTGAAVVSTWCLVQPLLCLAAFSGHAQILLKPVHRVHGGQGLEGFEHDLRTLSDTTAAAPDTM